MSVVLAITYTPTYPDAGPGYEVNDPEGVDSEDVAELLPILAEKVGRMYVCMYDSNEFYFCIDL